MIIVFGSINIDIVGHAPALMRPGETVLGSTLDIIPGGKGANQALAAARAGAETRLIGCIGQDQFTETALMLLREAGVDLSFVRRMDRHTGTALIVVDDAGENMITVLPGANTRLSAHALVQAGIGAGDTLLLQLETPLDAVEAAARHAHAAGARVILNLAPVQPVAREIFDFVSMLVVNETEMAGLLNALGGETGSPEAAVAWLSESLGMPVVATLGARGAVACEAGAAISVPGIAIKPVDTVGAGDSFVGYLAAGLAEGLALKDAMILANTAAALACLTPGAQSSIPERDAVEDKLVKA